MARSGAMLLDAENNGPECSLGRARCDRQPAPLGGRIRFVSGHDTAWDGGSGWEVFRYLIIRISIQQLSGFCGSSEREVRAHSQSHDKTAGPRQDYTIWGSSRNPQPRSPARQNETRVDAQRACSHRLVQQWTRRLRTAQALRTTRTQVPTARPSCLSTHQATMITRFGAPGRTTAATMLAGVKAARSANARS